MQREITLKAPVAGDGWMGLLEDYEDATKVIESWRVGKMAAPEHIRALRNVICFFVDPSEREETAQWLKQYATYQTVYDLIAQLPELMKWAVAAEVIAMVTRSMNQATTSPAE